MAVTIGLHMICKAETDRLRDCLESLKPVAFDQIVIGITGTEGWEGETRQIVEEYGGEAVDLTWLPKIQDEGYGECVASFSQARNEAYDRLTTDWAFWIDADDTLDGAELLRPLIENTLEPQGYGCLMLPYFYGFDASGNCITILTRERAVKRGLGWKWIRRVHEGMMTEAPNVAFARSPEIIVRHNSPTGRGWPARNLKLLMMEHEENPNDPRTVNYIGHQYYAMEKWAEAARWYERFLKIPGAAVEERWQALSFLGDCYRMTGQLERAILVDLEAVKLFPDWADPYFGLAETYARLQDWEACKWWDKVGRSAKVPDRAIFFNPVDYSYNPALFSNIAYFQTGDLDTAIKIVEDALKVSPKAEVLQQQIQAYYYVRDVREKASGVLKLWEGFADEDVLKTPVPVELLDVPEVRTRVARAALNMRTRRDGPWAVFFCGKSLEPWAPFSLREGGIGGSETAVIHVAKGLAEAGWHVDVYNDCEPFTGTYDGVGYWPYQWYRPDLNPDLLIGWRQAGTLLTDAQAPARVRWEWLHDLHMVDLIGTDDAEYYDRFAPVSQWHGDYLKMVYPFLGDKVRPTRNGIDLARFTHEVERNPKKVVYSSSPDRGLDALLAIWPEIVGQVPEAVLHVFYGWENVDKFPHLRPWKAAIEELLAKTPNAIWRGRVDQDTLAREFLSAGCWFYPTTFPEVSCITAMECMAAGVAILASDCGALPETVGNRGILLPGYPNSEVYQRMFIEEAVDLLTNEEYRAFMGLKGQNHAPNLSWDLVVKEWLEEWEYYAAAKKPK